MDTLFRLVSLQSDQYSYNSSRTSSSSRSSKHHHQDCYDLYMDEDDFSSSSSRHFYVPYYTGAGQQQQQASPNTNTPTNTSTNTSANTSSHVFDSTPHHADQFSFCPDPSITHFASSASGKWAADLLLQCARAFADKNSAHVQQFMWMLNELGSPYGDTEQKVASYFLQALFCRITDSGLRCHRTLTSASEKTCSFESTRKMLLKFQEVSPWTTFGHVACNGAILEALEGDAKLHIVDMSNTFCTQWPTLLEALATRTDDTPHLRITTVVPARAVDGAGGGPAAVHRVMKEIGSRMEKFARLMGVPFKFNVVYHASGDISDINLDELDIKEDESVAVNCVGTLHTASPCGSSRDSMISSIRRMGPKILTVVEDEADLDIGEDGHHFVSGFQECVRWFSVYFESLDQSFPRASNERLMLERAAGRALVDLMACPQAESRERRETAGQWSRRLHGAGLSPVPFSNDVSDDVRALLRRYQEGWSTTTAADAGIFLAWKDQPVVWASAWKL